MKYLSRKLIREEINKINPKIDFEVKLSSERFQFYDDKSYVIIFNYKKFKDKYSFVYPIKREVIRMISNRTLRKILNYEILRVNKIFVSYNSRKEIIRRTIEADKEWACTG